MNWIEENKLKRRISYLETCYLELSKLIVTQSNEVSLEGFADNMKILRDDAKRNNDKKQEKKFSFAYFMACQHIKGLENEKTNQVQ